MRKPFDFNNSSALVIGGGTGIGKEIAKTLCEHGCKVIIAGRREDVLNETVDEINAAAEGNCSCSTVDVVSEKSIHNLISIVGKKFDGKLNILVNSAGTNIRAPIEEVTSQDFKEVIDTNLTGTFLVTKSALPFLKSADYSRVINLASIFSSVSYPERLSYASSKGGVLLFSKTIALELAETGITVNTISPGPLLTEINKKVLDDKENYKKFCERIPMKRFGESHEIISAALFLASPMSGYVTGSDIIVDGGWTSS